MEALLLGFSNEVIGRIYIIMNEKQLLLSGLPSIIIITTLENVTVPYGIGWSRRLRDRHTYGIYNIPVPGFRSAILEFKHSEHAPSPGNPALVTIGRPVHRWSHIPRLFLRVGCI